MRNLALVIIAVAPLLMGRAVQRLRWARSPDAAYRAVFLGASTAVVAAAALLVLAITH